MPKGGSRPSPTEGFPTIYQQKSKNRRGYLRFLQQKRGEEMKMKKYNLSITYIIDHKYEEKKGINFKIVLSW